MTCWSSEIGCQSHVRKITSTEVLRFCSVCSWLKFSCVHWSAWSFKIESLDLCAWGLPYFCLLMVCTHHEPLALSQGASVLFKGSLFRHWFGRCYDVRFHFSFIMFLSRNIIVIQVLFFFLFKKQVLFFPTMLLKFHDLSSS